MAFGIESCCGSEEQLESQWHKLDPSDSDKVHCCLLRGPDLGIHKSGLIVAASRSSNSTVGKWKLQVAFPTN